MPYGVSPTRTEVKLICGRCRRRLNDLPGQSWAIPMHPWTDLTGRLIPEDVRLGEVDLPRSSDMPELEKALAARTRL
jgi:hypothetical protein